MQLGDVGPGLSDALVNRGERCTLVRQGETFREEEAAVFRMDPAKQKHMDRVIDRVRPAGDRIKAVVHLWNRDLPATADLTVDRMS